jgi:hypothetical protein
MRVRQRHRLRKVLAWGTVVLMAILWGGLWRAYEYVTDSVTIVRLIKTEAPRYLTGSRIDLSQAEVRPFKGEIKLHKVSVHQAFDGVSFEVLMVPWMSIRHDPRALFEGRFEPSEVVVTHPTLRLCRRNDGTWNLQGLLASPWPGPVLKTPPIQILNGTVELSEGDPAGPATAILRDVAVRVEAGDRQGELKFDGTARGDTFDRVSIAGTVDVATGRVVLAGDVARLAISDPLRSRLRAELKPTVEKLGLAGGEVDLRINEMTFEPGAERRFHYDVAGHLRGASWNCPNLPFPLNDLTARFAVRDGVLTLDQADGYNGTTSVRIERSKFTIGDFERVPIDLTLNIVDLKLDERLRDWTPRQFAPLWRQFRPSGRVSVSVRAVREQEGGPLLLKVVTECLDVALLYEHFKYPLDHVQGRLVWEGDRVLVENVQTLVGGQPLSASGTIDHPGPRAIVRLDFQGTALPIDKALFDAMPADVRKVVDEFKPTGTVRGTATLRRTPPDSPDADPRGKVELDAYLDLNERCGIKWKGMPYPVNNLTGRLEIHPDLWEFKNMRGDNGQAVITGSGRVQKVGGSAAKPALKVDLRLNAIKLPFDDQLKDALPPAWKKTWPILKPTGSSDVNATIKVEPGQPDSYVLEIVPRAATSFTRMYTRAPGPGDSGGTFELPMDHVTGRFVFMNGPVFMHDVGFRFFGASVQFARGWVKVEDTGKFDLRVGDLWVKDIRLDQRLQKVMPPVMAQFAQRLDDGRTFTLKGDMQLTWNGLAGAPVRCDWGRALVVFNDNAVQIQPNLSLKNIQGQLDHVHGWTDGETFDVHGALNLASVSLLGQQITRLESPIDVDHGEARLDNLRGRLLGGALEGKLSITLTATPRYSASLSVQRADLQEYARTLPGRQTFRGLVDARLDLAGLGGDAHTLSGGGEAHVVNGDLGELPVYLQLVKVLTLSRATKTAFDSADVALTIRNGKTYLEPIQFTGDAFSLHGRGTMDVQGELDLRLRVLYGRDRMHLRLVSDALREASGQFLVVSVRGTPSFPKFRLEPLPEVSDVLKSIGQRRGDRDRPPPRGEPR